MVLKKIDITLTAKWENINPTISKIKAELQLNQEDIIYETEMVVCELLENAIKYYDTESEANNKIKLSVVLQKKEISVSVSNVIKSEKDLDEFVAHIKRLKTQDARNLFVKRMEELINIPDPKKTELGLYRIAFEGGYFLKYKYSKGMLSVIATKKYDTVFNVQRGKKIFKIKWQLLIILLFVAIIPLLIILTFTINRIFNHLESQYKQNYSVLLNQVSNNIDFLYDQYARTFTNMMLTPEVVEVINAPPYKTKSEEVDANKKLVGKNLGTEGGIRFTVEEKLDGSAFLIELKRKSLRDGTNYKVHNVSPSSQYINIEELKKINLFLDLQKSKKSKLVVGMLNKKTITSSKKKIPAFLFSYYSSRRYKNYHNFDILVLLILFNDFFPQFYAGIDQLQHGTLYILDQFNSIIDQSHPGDDDMFNYDDKKKQYIIAKEDLKDKSISPSPKEYLSLNTDSKILNQKSIKNILGKLPNDKNRDYILGKLHYVTFNNIKYLAVFGYAPKSKCKLVYFHPLVQIRKPIYDIIKAIFIITLIIIFFIIVFSLILSTTLSNPIMRLAEASLKIANGDYGVSIDINSNNEISILSNGFNKMVKEIKNYTENLEHLVEQKTKDLRNTHEQLKIAHKALWGEMELTKRIQKSLLPDNIVLEGYDVAAKMIASEEVGGDIYNIITTKGEKWLIIGDVSGHGVTPGLIMMMVHSSILSILYKNPNISPKSLFLILNSVLMSNLSKLDLNKYMTISILHEKKPGTFIGCGKHNDILVYRDSEKRVQNIETTGVWLGLTEEIEDFVNEYSIILNKNDTMVLCTDGIFEATNSEDEMFEKRMNSALLENISYNSNKILDNILKEVHKYSTEQKDDMTIIVLKY